MKTEGVNPFEVAATKGEVGIPGPDLQGHFVRPNYVVRVKLDGENVETDSTKWSQEKNFKV